MASPAGEPPCDRTRLILTIQRQTETLDKLHAALKVEKEKASSLMQANASLEIENKKLATLQVENAEFRRELTHLQGLVLEFQRRQDEYASHEVLALEQQAIVHNSEAKTHRDHIDNLTRDVLSLRSLVEEKDSRIAILVDKLSVEGNDVDIKLQIEQMRGKMSELQKELKLRAEQCRALTTQVCLRFSPPPPPPLCSHPLPAKQSDHLRLSLDTAQEDVAQRDDMIQGLERENRAYKKNISQLIQQKHGRSPSVAPTVPGTGRAPPPPEAGVVWKGGRACVCVLSEPKTMQVYEPLFDPETRSRARSELPPAAHSPQPPPQQPQPVLSPPRIERTKEQQQAEQRLHAYRQRARRQ